MANVERSYREIALANRVAWAKRNFLHERAIEYAGKYLNLSDEALQLISSYEVAADRDPGPAREDALRHAWVNVIQYMRLLSRKESEAA